MNETAAHNQTIEVEPHRLLRGGDIAAAFSAEIIATTFKSIPTIRPPFYEGGRLYVTTALLSGVAATAYELVACAAEATSQPGRDGFSGRKVRSGADYYLLQGPPVRFLARTVAETHDASPTPNKELSTRGAHESTGEWLTSLIPQDDPPPHTLPAPPAIPVEEPALSPRAEHDEEVDESEGAAEASEEAGEAAHQIAPASSSTAQPVTTTSTNQATAQALPSRSYDFDEAPIKLFLTLLPGDGHLLGREIRIGVQIYDDAPRYRRVREREARGWQTLIESVLGELRDSLPALHQAYQARQEAATRKLAAQREKELAERVRQQTKAKYKKPTSAPPTTRDGTAASAPASAQSEAAVPLTSALASTPSPPGTGEHTGGIGAVDDPPGSRPPAPVTAPQSIKTSAARPPVATKSPDTQGSLFG